MAEAAGNNNSFLGRLAARPLPAFLLLLGLLGLALSRVAFVETHWDEDACAALGWVLSRGWKLYGDVFSHHMPLECVPGWALASVFGAGLAVYRWFMLALWAAVCLGLFQALRRRGGAGTLLVPVLFALLSAQWLTYWRGQMLLLENLWGYAVVLFLALAGTPLGFPEFEVRRSDALAAGALLGLILCASPLCAPIALCLAAFPAKEPRWRARWRWAAAGLALWLAAFLLWCLGHADLGRWYAEVFTFNASAYAGSWGFGGRHPLLAFAARAARDNAAYFAGALSWGNAEQYFEGLLKLASLGWVARELLLKRFFGAGCWLLLLFGLKARHEFTAIEAPFHSAPFYLAATLLVSRELSLFWGALRARPARLRLAAAAFGAFLLLPAFLATAGTALALRRFAARDAQYETLLGSIKNCTAPDGRIAVFPFYPRLYLDSGRLPAVPNVFYTPWQAAWPPEREAVMAALARNRPAAVVIQRTSIRGEAWDVYGAPVNAWLRANYVSVAKSAEGGGKLPVQLWIPREAAPEFVACARGL